MNAELRLPAQPRYIQIESVIGCDAKCPFCPQKNIVRGPRAMPDETWRKIVDDTRGLGVTYRPFLQNEALVDPRIEEIVRYIKRDPTARVEINTNANALTEKRAAGLIDAGVDLMRFSVDAFSREVYE
ncbi:MAG TPA: radical SAM protein, partial [Alphaproteobacteria bacterium]|nr:radical SAM protein [Alphaproteobacteria bacterium]